MLSMKGKHCHGCPLEKTGAGFAHTAGDGTELRILVAAEALGAEEAARGEPLVGAAGKTWDRLVGGVYDPVLGRNLKRDDFLLTNVVHCQPPGNVLVGASYEHAAIASCRPYLEGTLRSFKPRAVIALGNVALRWFTGNWGIEQLRGYVFDSTWGPVIPTYHPSYIQRGKWNLARVVQLDILKALQVAREGVAALHAEKFYTLSPNAGEVREFLAEWRAAGRPPLAFDIETPKVEEASENEEMVFSQDPSYTVLMISLAWKRFHAISIPWIAGLKELVIEALAEPADFVVWNAPFDVPRLEHNGVKFGGRVVDAMLAWHWLEPSLPMGLKYVATFICPDMHAWKLDMHRNFQWYNAADSDVLLRVYQEIKCRLTEQGRWKTFERHFLDYGKLLSKLTWRGITVDHTARAEARTRFQTRFDETVARSGDLAPQTILSLSPKRGYKKEPRDTKGMVRILVELTPEEEAKKREQLAKQHERERKRYEIEQRKRARKEAAAAKKAAKQEKAAVRRKK